MIDRLNSLRTHLPRRFLSQATVPAQCCLDYEPYYSGIRKNLSCMQMLHQLKSGLMGKKPNNAVFQYLLILCLSIALVLSQTNRLHMHFMHDDHSSASSVHIVDVHTVLSQHDFDHHEDHHSESHHPENHHPAAIDISPDNLIKKTNLLNPLLFILLFIGLFLYIPRLLCLSRQRLYQTRLLPCNYLLHPPLRAPPL